MLTCSRTHSEKLECSCWSWISWGHSEADLWYVKCLSFIILFFCQITLTSDPSNQVCSSSSPSGRLLKLWRNSLEASLSYRAWIPGSLVSSGSAPEVIEVLFWAETDPPSEFDGNLWSSFCVIMPNTPQMETGEDVSCSVRNKCDVTDVGCRRKYIIKCVHSRSSGQLHMFWPDLYHFLILF